MSTPLGDFFHWAGLAYLCEKIFKLPIFIKKSFVFFMVLKLRLIFFAVSGNFFTAILRSG